MLENQKFEQEKSLDQAGYQPGKDLSAMEQMNNSGRNVDIDSRQKNKMEDLVNQSYENDEKNQQAYNFTPEQKADYMKMLESMNASGQPIDEGFLKTMRESGVIDDAGYEKYSGGKEYQPEGATMIMDEGKVKNDFGTFLNEQKIDMNTLTDEEKKNLIDWFKAEKGYGDVSNDDYYKMMSKITGVKEEKLYSKNVAVKTGSADSGGTNNGQMKVEGGYVYDAGTGELKPPDPTLPPTNPWGESINEDWTNY